MRQTTKRFSSIIFSALFIVAATIVFFEFLQPEYATFISDEAQLAGAQATLASTQSVASTLTTALAQYENTSTPAAQAVNLAMPIGADNSAAVAQIYGLAQNSGLTIESLDVSYTAPPGASTPSISSAGGTTLAALTKTKGSMTFQIGGFGSYEALKTFLAGLAQNVRLFNVTAVSLHPAASSANLTGAAAQDLFTCSVTAVAYYQPS